MSSGLPEFEQAVPTPEQEAAANSAADAMTCAAARVGASEYVVVSSALLVDLFNSHAREAVEIGPDRFVERLARSLLKGE
ncbi:MAG TPA: hypothetical protein VK735_18495 [Pseudonocardia sp.]|uniref:hypothetical protein n=1 Tax=Pseudonocardia sp. TaxID=60912 RepID=UPI002BB60F3B|nr:hypothetical protein [Pseudonocardia sp.]HTF49436.1 hypothetical protein [Pseudonocardia sp.]